VNLAKHLAEREHFSEAIQLWENALSRNPGLLAPGINLSQVYLQNGNRPAAQELLLKVLEFNPDLQYAWKLWSTLSKKGSQ
jgi:tetratricopeptide (TPR) repeat protein